jgi:protein XagA
MTRLSRKIVLVTSLTALVLCSSAGEVRAGAWTQPKGGYYLKFAGGYFHATDDIDASGKRVAKPGEGHFRDFNYSVYTEYGVADDLTFIASVPYKRLHDKRTFASGITREHRTGMGDAEIRLRRSLLRGRTVAAVALGVKIPLWSNDDPGTRVPLSSGGADWDVRLLAGRSITVIPAYVTGEIGYRSRGGGLSAEVLYAIEGGVTMGRFLIKGFLSGVRTRGDCHAASNEVGLIGDQDVMKVSPGIIYRPRPNLEVGLERITIASGCNTTAGSTWLLGIALKR